MLKPVVEPSQSSSSHGPCGPASRSAANFTYLDAKFDSFPGVAQSGTLSGYRNQPGTYGGLVRYRF